MEKIDIEGSLKRIYDIVKEPLLFYDVETTGIDLNKDDIIQIFIAKYDGSSYIEYESKFNTRVAISPGAQEKHKISKDDLKGLPYFADKAEEIWGYFDDPSLIICGYNHPKFDNPIIIARFIAAGIKQSVQLIKNKQLDGLAEVRRIFPNNLEAVFTRLTGETLEHAHDARYDIYATARIVEELFKHDDITPEKQDVIDVDGFFRADNGVLRFNKGKHKDKAVKEIGKAEALSYLDWMINKAKLSDHTKQVALQVRTKVAQIL